MRPFAPGQAGVSQPRPLSAATVVRPNRLLVVTLLLLALAPPAYLLQTGGALTTGYTIQTLEKERATWLVRNQQLEVELARARSLAWIEHEAVHRLGMHRPAEQTVVRMDVPPPAVQARLPSHQERPERPATLAPEPADDGRSWIEDITAAVAGLIADD